MTQQDPDYNTLKEQLAQTQLANRMLVKVLKRIRQQQTQANTTHPPASALDLPISVVADYAQAHLHQKIAHLQKQLDDADSTLKLALSKLTNSAESMRTATFTIDQLNSLAKHQASAIERLSRELHNYICPLHSANFQLSPTELVNTRPYIHPFARPHKE